jgi:O-antigen ligase
MLPELNQRAPSEENEEHFHSNGIFWVDWLVALLLFAFPLFAVSVRHWASTTFALICLLGLVEIARRRRQIFSHVSRAEWVLVAFVVAFFGSFLLTSFLVGWDESAERALGTEIRFLLFIPIYFLVRNNPFAFRALVWGSAVAVFANFGFVYYEVEQLNRAQVHLVYSSLFVGPITAIFAAIAVFGLRAGLGWVEFIYRFLIIAAALYVAMHTSRSAILAVVFLGLMSIAWLQKRYRCATFLVFALLGAAAVISNDFAYQRANAAYHEFSSYIENELSSPEQSANKKGGGSIGTRLEMVKAAQYVLEESPWLGLGRYHYTDFVREQVEKGLLNQSVSRHGHPHNMFIAALFFKGLIGLAIVLLIFIFSFFYLFKSRHRSDGSSLAGATFIIVLLSAQMTESAVLIKGNFIAVLLIGLAVMFSNTAMKNRATKTSK